MSDRAGGPQPCHTTHTLTACEGPVFHQKQACKQQCKHLMCHHHPRPAFTAPDPHEEARWALENKDQEQTALPSAMVSLGPHSPWPAASMWHKEGESIPLEPPHRTHTQAACRSLDHAPANLRQATGQP